MLTVASPIYVICKFNLFLRALLRVGLYCFLPVETVLIAWCLFKLLIDIPRSADDLGQFITPSVYSTVRRTRRELLNRAVPELSTVHFARDPIQPNPSAD